MEVDQGNKRPDEGQVSKGIHAKSPHSSLGVSDGSLSEFYPEVPEVVIFKGVTIIDDGERLSIVPTIQPSGKLKENILNIIAQTPQDTPGIKNE